MPIPTDTFWNVRRLNWVFAASGIVLMLTMAWATLQDYDKHWRDSQRQAKAWETAFTDAKLEKLHTPEEQARLKQLRAMIERQDAQLKAHDKEIVPIEQQITKLKSEISTIQFEQNILKANVSVSETHLEEATAAGDTARQKELTDWLEPRRQQVAAMSLEMEKKNRELEEEKNKLADRTRDRDELVKQQKKLLADEEALTKKRNQLDPKGVAWVSNVVRGIPLLQFMNPVEKVQQQVVPDVLTELGSFMKVTTIDRCMTCHANIADKNFTEENVLAFLEEQAAQARGLNLPTTPPTRATEPLATFDQPGAAALPEFWHNWAAKLAPDAVKKESTRLAAIAKTVGSPGVEVMYAGQPVKSFAYEPGAADAATAERQDAILSQLLIAWAKYGKSPNAAKNAVIETSGGKAVVRITPAAVDAKIADPAKTAALKYPEVVRAALEASLNASDLRTLRDRYRYALIKVVNDYRDERGEPELYPGREIFAHPDLSLYVSLDSPHPFEASEGKLGVGCTGCHDGSGQETTFVLAAHTPRQTWVDAKTGELVLPSQLKNDNASHGNEHSDAPTMSSMLEAVYPESSLVPQSASLHLHAAEKPAEGHEATNHAEAPGADPIRYVDPATGREGRAVSQESYWSKRYALESGTDFDTLHHRWDWPMRPVEYLQANCVRCHSEVNDIAKQAPVLAEGRALFTTMGCVNCHQMDSISAEEKRQVGPDLRHVTSKLSPAFIDTWIWAPKAFRPSTKMPHFFMLENNSSDEEIRRTRQEALAITEYLTQTAPPREPAHKLPDNIKGDAKNGQALFNTIGCLGCHTNLNDPGSRVPTKAEEWITTDLIKNGDLARQLEADVGKEVAEKLERELPATVEKDLTTRVTRTVTDAVTKELAPKPATTQPATKPTKEQQDALKKQIDDEVKKRLPAALAEAKQKEMPALVEKAKADLPRNIDRQKATELTRRVQAKAKELYNAMTYNERQLYALEHFDPPAGARHEIDRYPDNDDPNRRTAKPVFVHHGPELSGIGTKLLSGRTEDQARAWLFDWLKEPRHHSDYTVMPNLRLTDQQAADLVAYLLDQKRTKLDPKDKWEAKLATPDPEKLREMTALFLRSRYTMATAYAKAEDDAEITKLAVDALTTEFADKAAAEQQAAKLDLDHKRLVFLGKKLISHYGCMGCHQVPGDDQLTSSCPNLSDWGQKGLDKLDFAYLDHHKVEELPDDARTIKVPMVNAVSVEAALLAHETPANPSQPVAVAWPHVEHLRESWITQKLKNTRVYDRGKSLLEPKPAAGRSKGESPLAEDLGKPYDKLKMPTFYLNDEQVHALVTWVISNRDPLVSERMRLKGTGEESKKIAYGRYLTQKYNCVGCHRTEDNAPAVQQNYALPDVGTKAPPNLWGEGTRVNMSWLFNFLGNVQPLRPLLMPQQPAAPNGGIRMPSFPVTAEERAAIAAYFVAASERESNELKRHVGAIDRYVADAKKKAEEDQKQRDAARSIAAAAGGNGVQLASADGAGAALAAASVNGSAVADAGADWFKQPALADSRDALARWALDNSQFIRRQLDPLGNTPADLEANYGQLLYKARFLADLFAGPPAAGYLLTDTAPPQITEERFQLGQKLFFDMQCLQCHTLGDPAAKGALPNPTAPSFSLTQQRIQRRWARHWVQETSTIQPGTAMPPFFTGLPVLKIDGQSWPQAQPVGDPVQQAWIQQYVEKAYGPDANAQADLVLDFLYAAGARGHTAVQPPQGQFGPPPVPPDFKPPQPATKPSETVAEAPKAAPQAAPAAPAGKAVVAGKVVFQGDPPPVAELPMGGVAQCAALHAGPVPDPSVIVNGNGTLRNVVVYVSGGAPAGQPAPREPVVLNQHGCLYEPRVLAAMVGQDLVVKNSDPFLHNVHGLPAANPPFNQAQPNLDPGKKMMTFAATEQFIVKCDVHPWMLAHVRVFDHPFFATSNDQGAFEIKGLPAGTYTLTAWHEKFGEQSQDVTVQEGQPAQVTFTFKAGGAADAGRAVEMPEAAQVILAELFPATLPKLPGASCCTKCRTTPSTVVASMN